MPTQNYTRPPSMAIDTLLEKSLKAAADTRAEDIKVYDLSQKSSLADFVVIMSGRSSAHTQGISEKVRQSCKPSYPRSEEGYAEASWILMDYDDVIVHIFQSTARSYYHLEELLKDYSEVSEQFGHILGAEDST